MKKGLDLKDIVIQMTISAIYVVLVFVFYFMSFEAIQFRIAEILLVLVFFNKKHTIGLVFGTFLANYFGAFGLIDALYGSLATLLVCIFLYTFRKQWVLALLIFPALFNGLVIAFEISYHFDTFNVYWFNFGTIALGELIVVALLGIPFMLSLKKTDVLMEYLT
ncbi:QueT transporter family protein [Acholeplasma laidlawii]|uniref:QueT transporter family protein n=1 Tax=Acholeplasma laidlawii TaxID=2148 RepID=UPI0018C2BB6C|nr:QueT transporter family protein [Acholeplasma laidlawii]MBG0762096.1 QueT transporter family protein [Acholeplasma laidlawii]